MDSFTIQNNGLEAQSFSALCDVTLRRLQERGCALAENGERICITLDASLQEDEYFVSAKPERVQVRAGGVSGAFAGIGAFLESCAFDGRGQCRPFVGEKHLKPVNPIHGMYFATHFRNFYESAPVDEVLAIIGDLALRGSNALMIWYDMHQYTGVDDPQSVEMIARLKSFMRYASICGMKTVFLKLANETFSGSDPAIRAEWTAQNGYVQAPYGHYHLEICPNKEGGLAEILRQRRIVMEAFADVKLDYIVEWPYDQGGCTCEKCAPWGGNGLLKTVDALHELYREILPDAKILLSTWYFERFYKGDWDAFNAQLNAGRCGYVDFLFGYFANDEFVPDYIRNGDMPGGKRMVAFPEISMWGAEPWGGFGANPMPERMESNFRENGGLYCGALPYSEGIFEDINKCMMLAFYSGKTKSAEEVLRTYARFELCIQGEALIEDFVRMCRGMEALLPRRQEYADGRKQIGRLKSDVRYEDVRFTIRNPADAEEVEALSAKLDAALPEAIRSSWRWRVLRLRAIADLELVKNHMALSPRFEKCMEELTRIYHAENAYYVVSPLTRDAVLEARGGDL